MRKRRNCGPRAAEINVDFYLRKPRVAFNRGKYHVAVFQLQHVEGYEDR